MKRMLIFMNPVRWEMLNTKRRDTLLWKMDFERKKSPVARDFWIEEEDNKIKTYFYTPDLSCDGESIYYYYSSGDCALYEVSIRHISTPDGE